MDSLQKIVGYAVEAGMIAASIYGAYWMMTYKGAEKKKEMVDYKTDKEKQIIKDE